MDLSSSDEEKYEKSQLCNPTPSHSSATLPPASGFSDGMYVPNASSEQVLQQPRSSSDHWNDDAGGGGELLPPHSSTTALSPEDCDEDAGWGEQSPPLQQSSHGHWNDDAGRSRALSPDDYDEDTGWGGQSSPLYNNTPPYVFSKTF